MYTFINNSFPNIATISGADLKTYPEEENNHPLIHAYLSSEIIVDELYNKPIPAIIVKFKEIIAPSNKEQRDLYYNEFMFGIRALYPNNWFYFDYNEKLYIIGVDHNDGDDVERLRYVIHKIYKPKEPFKQITEMVINAQVNL